jgi:hypothetical protein
MQYDPHQVGQHSVEITPGVLQPGIKRIELRVLPPSDSSASMPQGASAFSPLVFAPGSALTAIRAHR